MKSRVGLWTWAAILAGIAMLWRQSTSLLGVLFIVPFSLGPLFVTLMLGFYAERKVSQRLLLVSTGAYAAWFLYIYLHAFHWHLDAQSALALLFVGVYSLPVMLPLWISSFLLRKEKGNTPPVSIHQSNSES